MHSKALQCYENQPVNPLIIQIPVLKREMKQYKYCAIYSNGRQKFVKPTKQINVDVHIATLTLNTFMETDVEHFGIGFTYEFYLTYRTKHVFQYSTVIFKKILVIHFDIPKLHTDCWKVEKQSPTESLLNLFWLERFQLNEFDFWLSKAKLTTEQLHLVDVVCNPGLQGSIFSHSNVTGTTF